MKTGIVGAILILAFCVAGANAEDAMSSAKLSKLGLSSMKVASDEAGMEVRGTGKVFISGAHIALAGPSASSVSYGAGVDRTPWAFAIGGGAAIADYTIISSISSPISLSAIARGSAIAYAP